MIWRASALELNAMADSERQAVKSANRVLDLFELLGQWGNEMSHTQIAAALRIPKSSLSQLLPNLVERGYIDYVAASRGYRLGPKMTTLVREASFGKDIQILIPPILEEITDQTGESSALNILNGDMSEVTASISSPQRLVSHMRVGDVAPLYATSGGKALLTAMPESVLEAYLERVVFEKITHNTITSVAELRRQLATARREGIAYAFEEFTPGIAGMAIPILPGDARPLSSLNIALPAVRYNSTVRENLAEALTRAAAVIRDQIERKSPRDRKS
jgi:DNA-binding IclR family transcriptional regulator